MHVTYDAEVNIVAFYLDSSSQEPEEIDRTEITESPGVYVDRTKEGKVVGIEIHQARERLDIEQLKSFTFEELTSGTPKETISFTSEEIADMRKGRILSTT